MRIGVFDSGVGGLTVLRELRRRYPAASTIYLGDTARVPYGTKSAETVERYALNNAAFLVDQGVDLIVVACNTASAWAMDALGSMSVPCVGVVEPGARLALRLAEGGPIGILGTAGTIRSGAYERAIEKASPDCAVSSIACPLFVPLAEEGWGESEIAKQVARQYLRAWIESPGSRPRAVILGCTHYPMLRNTIAEILGEASLLVDSAGAVAKAIEGYVAQGSPESEPEHRLILTDASEGFVELAEKLLDGSNGGVPHIEHVDLNPIDASRG